MHTFKGKRKSAGKKQRSPHAGGNKPRHNQRRRSGGGRAKSKLDPNMLVRKATAVEQEPYRSDRTIDQLPIHPKLIENLLKKGFSHPTEIQDRTLEPLLEGRDMLGIAQTGTGKTAAFLVPIIQELMKGTRKPYALVLVPTRELAMQVQDEFKSMTSNLQLYSEVFIGGTNINRDLQRLRRASHVVIATPGRLLDLVSRKAMDLRGIHTLVLDEFDRMLDMGFEKDVMRIISGMQNRQHSLLFSATIDPKQRHLINNILQNPVTIEVSTGNATSAMVDQDIIRLGHGQDKLSLLASLVNDEDCHKALIFEETKHRVSKLCKQLNDMGIRADEIHGNKTQNARQTALNRFKAGKVKVLIATDVAARGIDVDDISHVINYEVPQSYDSYVHRIGRTGRAGKKGIALTFVAS